MLGLDTHIELNTGNISANNIHITFNNDSSEKDKFK